MTDPAALRRAIAAEWEESPYYAAAEGWLDTFWSEGSPFLRLFRQLDLSRVVELACGRGRHAAQILDQAGEITLVDVLESNIAACRARFAGRERMVFIVNAGDDLPGIEDASRSALFCYDAMVHFELTDVWSYLRETARILRPGGRALLHVSNFMEHPGGDHHDNPHWRNFGGLPVIRHLAARAGLSTLAAEVLDWPGAPGLDGLLLLER
ncbi:MAG: class I SAM-dependent methyltransferase [Rhodovarius sp.]|nr:class I SAM-dependent methyltransferase [Rhodovarius sp.]MCX7932829.1 class I SAM-dependent methyltransferase [Rhodovarius sp.]MDW8313779.1 class I SAM-dependent methyltransferase [Rhodovarius sp.]